MFSKSLASMMVSAIFISSTYAAPAAAPVAAASPLQMLQKTMQELGRTPEHPYVLPYCGGATVNISTENAGYIPDDPTGAISLPPNMEVLLVDMLTPVDLSAYDNSLGALAMEVQFPSSHADWVNQLNLTGLLFTSNSSAPFDPARLNTSSLSERIAMNLGFSFMTSFNDQYEENGDEDGPVYLVITSAFVRVPIADNQTLAGNGPLGIPTLDASGKYLVEMGFMMSCGPDVDVSEIRFSDIYLMCLPTPSAEELQAQNITYWKKEISPGKYELSPALQAATQ